MTELDLSQLVNLGPMGVMGAVLLWFMRRLEKYLDRGSKAEVSHAKKLDLMAQAIFRWLERTDHEEARRLSKELSRVNGDE